MLSFVIKRRLHLILPAIVLAASNLAEIMRQMRSNLPDALRAVYLAAALRFLFLSPIQNQNHQ